MSEITMGNPTDDKPNSFPKFELKLPMFGLGQKDADVDDKERRGQTEADAVKFSEPKPATPPPLKHELDEPPIPNCLIVWPVRYQLQACIIHFFLHFFGKSPFC